MEGHKRLRLPAPKLALRPASCSCFTMSVVVVCTACERSAGSATRSSKHVSSAHVGELPAPACRRQKTGSQPRSAMCFFMSRSVPAMIRLKSASARGAPGMVPHSVRNTVPVPGLHTNHPSVRCLRTSSRSSGRLLRAPARSPCCILLTKVARCASSSKSSRARRIRRSVSFRCASVSTRMSLMTE